MNSQQAQRVADDIVERRMRNTGETHEQATAHVAGIINLIAAAAGSDKPIAVQPSALHVPRPVARPQPFRVPRVALDQLLAQRLVFPRWLIGRFEWARDMATRSGASC